MILAQLRKDVDSVFAEDPERLNHIYGVRATAVILAHQQGVSMENAEVAAFLHDLTKNYTEEEHKALIEKYYDHVLNDYNEAIWHSFSAAAIARETYKVRNDDIIKAVESHTLGRPDMTTLEKILFVADYIEPNRPYANSKEVFKIAFKDLDRAVYRALERSIELFESKGETIPDVAYQARDFYKDAVEEKHGEN